MLLRRISAKAISAAGALALMSISPAATSASGASSRWEWDGVGRIVGVGDVHGRYDQLVAILQGAGLVDGQLRWTGKKDHLVLCGDMVDRGPDDRAVLDLVRRLQEEAAAAGGRVHALLGNHEAMNLVRDFRYVRPEGWAAFAGDEKSGDRQKAWEAYRNTLADKGLSPDQLAAAFEEKYPPGYFARRDAFGLDGRYGSWLLEQPAVIRINSAVFVHGGLTPEVASLGLDRINDRIHESLRSIMESSLVLDTVMKIPAGLADLHGAASQVAELTSQGRRIDQRVTFAATTLLEQMDELPFAPDGPLWYRGSSLADERFERERVSRVLQTLGARSIVVGHSVTRTGRVSARFDGRLIRGDVGMGYGRQGYAVVFEGPEASVFDPVTRTASAAYVEPPYGEGWTGGVVHLSDVRLEELLSNTAVVKRTGVNRGDRRAEIWEMEAEGLKLRGVFKDVEEERAEPSAGRASARRYEHEVAAYRLDRMLDLGLVPVVVVRESDGRRGALRSVVETALDLVSIRSTRNLEGATPEETIRTVAEAFGLNYDDIFRQVVGARVFDALIGNQERQDVDKLFVPAEGRVSLVDHEQAFTLSPDLDVALLHPCRPLPADLRIYLMILSAEELHSALGDYLSKDQIEAILKRRDRVMELCGVPEGESVAVH